jgi:hypothetical protein
MDDLDKIHAEVAAAEHEDREISNACARMIASLWHSGQGTLGYSFASTGEIPDDPGLVWRDLFGPWRDPRRSELKAYAKATRQDQRVMDALGSYLRNAGPREPVAGWSDKWL